MKSKDLDADEGGGGNPEFSPILTCIQTIQGSEIFSGNEKLNIFQRISLKELKRGQDFLQKDGFCFAVSLQDGSILYNSSCITKHLGCSKDFLTGQCILNLLHQKDHIIFANHLMQSLNAYLNQESNVESNSVPDMFFCRLRVFAPKQEKCFMPFKVVLDINELVLDELSDMEDNNAADSTLCVKATASPLSSAYQVPQEIPIMSSFSTRHTASCHFSHVDDSAVPYLGHLPQDMIGHSVFDFYHTDDMPQLKDTYELVMREQGVSFRSKPYRFKAFNGSYISLETEWSCFINPWSRKLEFIVGQHRVLRGPDNVDVFKSPKIQENLIPEGIMKECQAIENEIRSLLARPVQPILSRKPKHHPCKRKQPCTISFSDDDQNKDDCVEKHCSDDSSNTDSDCVVMGDISPHQDLNDSSTFSETPPTCQKLRFQENIERFFASQPKTFSDGSEEYKSYEKLSNSDESRGNTSKQPDSLPSTSTSGTSYNNKQHESSSGSSKFNFSSFNAGDSGYGQSLEDKKYPNTKADCYPKCAALTEESLFQHNRLHHKHMKHRKSKSSTMHASAGHRDGRSAKFTEGRAGNSINPHKHKKWSHGNVMTSTVPTQTCDVKVTAMQNQPIHHMNPYFATEACRIPMAPTITTSHPATTNAVLSPFGIPSYHPCIPATCPPESAAAAPFYMPVMYMGSIPCYPHMPSLIQTSAIPPWPCAPPSLGHASPVVFPGSVIPIPCPMPMPIVPTSITTTNAGSSLNVQSSGATATTTVLTTTTTVAPGDSSHAQNSCNFGSKSQAASEGIMSQNWSTSKCNKHNHGISKDSSFESSSISLTSHSCFTKSENTNSDMKLPGKCPPPLLQDPPWLIDVNLTPEVVYRYTLKASDINEVLMKDLEELKAMQQPSLVNKQLQMLQQEFKGKDLATAEATHESVMLGLTTRSTDKEVLLDQEDYLFQLTAEDM